MAIGHQHLPFTVQFPVRQDILLADFGKLIGAAFDNSVIFQKIVFRTGKNDFPFVKKDDIIRHLLQIAGDMGRYQNGMVFILDKLQKHVQNLIPHDRIQSAGSFIQNQQLHVMGKSYRNGIFHFHAFGKLFDFFVRRNLKPFQYLAVFFLIPAAIKTGKYFSHLSGRQHRRIIISVKNDAHLFPVHLLRASAPQQAHRTFLCVDQAQHRINGSTFSRAVFTDQPHDAPLGDCEGNVIQRKIPVLFCHSL